MKSYSRYSLAVLLACLSAVLTDCSKGGDIPALAGKPNADYLQRQAGIATARLVAIADREEGCWEKFVKEKGLSAWVDEINGITLDFAGIEISKNAAVEFPYKLPTGKNYGSLVVDLKAYPDLAMTVVDIAAQMAGQCHVFTDEEKSPFRTRYRYYGLGAHLTKYVFGEVEVVEGKVLPEAARIRFFRSPMKSPK